jgi:integrase
MGRRPKNDNYPRACRHKGSARIRIQGQEYCCGPWGSPEARTEQDRLIAEWIASGRTVPPKRRPRGSSTAHHGFGNPSQRQPPLPAPEPSGGQPEPQLRDVGPAAVEVTALPEKEPAAAQVIAVQVQPQQVRVSAEYATGHTVADIATLWLDWIERTQCPNGRDRTSLYYGARQAIRALEDFWEYPAADFGCPELTAVQERLVRTPVVSRPKDPEKKPRKRQRYRSTINDTVGRVRQLFKWAARNRLISREAWAVIEPDLKLVKPLLRGKTTAPDGPVERTVDDALVDATLPAVPEIVADYLRFQRFTGCRPGEARGLCLSEIDRRPIPSHKGRWVWRVPEWKLSWRERHIPRVIAIGPKAQVILQKWIDRLEEDAAHAIFSPRFSERNPTRWCKPDRGDKPPAKRSRSNRMTRKGSETYSKCAINTCIRRACDKLGHPRWTTNQLRHNRLTQIRNYQSLEESQAVAGHAKVNQTQHYAHQLLQKAIDAAETG